MTASTQHTSVPRRGPANDGGGGRHPLVSVIMPCLNQARYLPRALESVLGQRGTFDVECVAVDGGSRDESVAILDACGDAVRWTSEPDQGQSHALNKGLAVARGEIVGWLNSDDVYAPGAIQRVVEVFEREPETRWVYGKVVIIDEQGHVVRRPITAYKNVCMRRFSYRRLLVENWISQMGVFWRRSAGEEVGPFREDLRYAMDYDYWLRLGERWPGRFIDSYLSAFRWHPEGKTGGATCSRSSKAHAWLGLTRGRGTHWNCWRIGCWRLAPSRRTGCCRSRGAEVRGRPVRDRAHERHRLHAPRRRAPECGER